MSETNTDSLVPASSSSFSGRCLSRVRSVVSAARYRVRSRNRRIGLGGTKLARTSPCSTSCVIHAESVRSVSRPGTLRMRAAFSSCTSTCPPGRAQARPWLGDPDGLEGAVDVAAEDRADVFVGIAVLDQPAADVGEVLGGVLQAVDVG